MALNDLFYVESCESDNNQSFNSKVISRFNEPSSGFSYFNSRDLVLLWSTYWIPAQFSFFILLYYLFL